jgi:hypothetical protein
VGSSMPGDMARGYVEALDSVCTEDADFGARASCLASHRSAMPVLLRPPAKATLISSDHAGGSLSECSSVPLLDRSGPSEVVSPFHPESGPRSSSGPMAACHIRAITRGQTRCFGVCSGSQRRRR